MMSLHDVFFRDTISFSIANLFTFDVIRSIVWYMYQIDFCIIAYDYF